MPLHPPIPPCWLGMCATFPSTAMPGAPFIIHLSFTIYSSLYLCFKNTGEVFWKKKAERVEKESINQHSWTITELRSVFKMYYPSKIQSREKYRKYISFYGVHTSGNTVFPLLTFPRSGNCPLHVPLYLFASFKYGLYIVDAHTFFQTTFFLYFPSLHNF